jgi:hypothetical protein
MKASGPEAEGMIMPINDWTRVDAGIVHHFHQRRVGVITDVLNQRLLPTEYYPLAAQHGAGFEPDILTLKASEAPEWEDDASQPSQASRLGRGNAREADWGGYFPAAYPACVKP